MRCDNCGKKEAAIHLTTIVSNEMTTHHLCEACAAEKGLEPGAGAASAPLADFIAQMGKTVTPVTGAAGTCPSCGLTLADFKRTGRLGCDRCWNVFDASLRGLLRKLHGGTQHQGKVYMSADPTEVDRTARVASLRRSLQRAVEEEDFERAAALRDQIRRLEAVE